MNRVLAIDPGPTQSAWALIDEQYYPFAFGKDNNARIRELLPTILHPNDTVAIEMVASYGMPVGAEIFDTCVHIGRFIETSPQPARLVFRRDVKLHHCGTARASDANIIQALVDRFAKGQPNRGKGTKKTPGWFYEFGGDVWQAYALAVTIMDTQLDAEAI